MIKHKARLWQPIAELDALLGSLPETRENDFSPRMLLGISMSFIFHPAFALMLFYFRPFSGIPGYIWSKGPIVSIFVVFLACLAIWVIMVPCVYSVFLELDMDNGQREIIEGVVKCIVQPARRGVPVLLQSKSGLKWVHLSQANAKRLLTLSGEVKIVGKMYTFSKLVYEIDCIKAKAKENVKVGNLKYIPIKL